MKQYIRVEGKNVIAGFSGKFEQPLEGDIEYGEPFEGHFALFGVVNPSLSNGEVYLYKYEKGKVVAKTEAEIQKEIADLPVPPSVPSIQGLEAEIGILDTKVTHLGEVIDVILPPTQADEEGINE